MGQARRGFEAKCMRACNVRVDQSRLNMRAQPPHAWFGRACTSRRNRSCGVSGCRVQVGMPSNQNSSTWNSNDGVYPLAITFSLQGDMKRKGLKARWHHLRSGTRSPAASSAFRDRTNNSGGGAC